MHNKEENNIVRRSVTGKWGGRPMILAGPKGQTRICPVNDCRTHGSAAADGICFMTCNQLLTGCRKYEQKGQMSHAATVKPGPTHGSAPFYLRDVPKFFHLPAWNHISLYNWLVTPRCYIGRSYFCAIFHKYTAKIRGSQCPITTKLRQHEMGVGGILRICCQSLTLSSRGRFWVGGRGETVIFKLLSLCISNLALQTERSYYYPLKLIYKICWKQDIKKIPNYIGKVWRSAILSLHLCTTLSLQWEPEIIAIALMYLAGKLSKFEVADWSGRTSKHQRWWDMYVQGISMDLLEDICHQVLDLYSPNKSESVGSMGGSSNSSSGGVGTRRTSDTVSTPTGPPPAKKAKKEEVTASPVKVPEVVSTVPAVPSAGNQAASTSSNSSYSYPYPYPNYPPGPHNYPPPSAATSASTSGPPPRYPAPHPTYNYPPSSGTQVPPPQGPPQGPPPQQLVHQVVVPLPSSSSHYPPGPPAPANQAPPTHYPPPSHGSSSSAYYPPPPNASQGQPPPYQQSESRIVAIDQHSLLILSWPRQPVSYPEISSRISGNMAMLLKTSIQLHRIIVLLKNR
ncbi:unnamed protein product, partial [Meganyctiphanes norvegica]